MDLFSSETISSDSSTCESCPTPPSRKKAVFRKARRTEDLISLNTIEDSVQVKSEQSVKNQRLSFLPKIDLVADGQQPVKVKVNKRKKTRPSLAKHLATFKIGRSLIEGRLQGHTKLGTSKSKFPRIRLKLVKNKNLKSTMGQEQSNKNRREGPEELAQILSETVQEFYSESQVTPKLGSLVKHKRKSKSDKIELKDNSNASRMILRDLYVNLVPVETTDLLTEAQLSQLKRKANNKSFSTSVNKSRLSKSKQIIGKENTHTKKTLRKSNISTKHVLHVADKHDVSKSPPGTETMRPCIVILERLTSEKLQHAKNVAEFSYLNTSNEAVGEKKSVGKLKIYNTDLSVSVDGFDASRKRSTSTLEKSTRVSFGKSVANYEELDFNPAGSSSPLVEKASSFVDKNQTYEVDANKILKNLTVSDAGLENKNATYEIEGAVSLSDRLSKIVTDCEQLPHSSNRGSTLEPKTPATKSDRSSKTISKKTSPKSMFENETSPVLTIKNNLTNELNKTSNDALKEKSVKEDGTDKNATKSDFKSKSVGHSGQVESWPRSSKARKRRQSCDVKITTTKKRKSSSHDIIQAHHLRENKTQPLSSRENQETSPEPLAVSKRRLTLTLEESVNDIGLLKSVCDSSDTPQKLNKSKKAKSQDLVGKSSSSQLGYSLAKFLCLENGQESSRKSSKLVLESTSPPWSDDDSLIASSTYEVNKTDDFSIIPISPKRSGKQTSIRSTLKDKKETGSVAEKELPTTCIDSSDSDSDAASSKQTRRVTFERNFADTELIEISDEDAEGTFSIHSESSDCTDSDFAAENSTKQTCRVTFGIDVVQKENSRLQTVSALRTNTPKPRTNTKTNNVSGPKNRRVTFSDMSVIIIDDSFPGSAGRKSSGTPVPTNFPSDDENGESSDEPQQPNQANQITKDADFTQPGPSRIQAPRRNDGSDISIQSEERVPLVRLTRVRIDRTPIHIRNTPQCKEIDVDSAKFNKRGTVGRTPMRLALASTDSKNSFASPGLNKNISSKERLRLENDFPVTSETKETKSSSVPKKSKMPDFAKVHKKLFDKMQSIKEYSKHKDERAKLLLSGRKPGQTTSSVKASPRQSGSSGSKTSKKQLAFAAKVLAKKPAMHDSYKKPLLVSSTPKDKKNKKSGYTRYGFKIVETQPASKKEQLMAVANKIRPPKPTVVNVRSEIRGVRSNRRFELLMQMRQKKQK